MTAGRDVIKTGRQIAIHIRGKSVLCLTLSCGYYKLFYDAQWCKEAT